MNKLIILVIVITTIIIIGFGIFDDEPIIKQFDTNQNDVGFEVIKPPLVGLLDDVSDKERVKLDLNNKKNVKENKVYARGSKENIKTMRRELIALKKNENVTYETLGAILEKQKNNKYTSSNAKADLERVQHNLNLSRKISNLTRKLHYKKNGKNELDQTVLAQIMALQKQLIIQTNFQNINVGD